MRYFFKRLLTLVFTFSIVLLVLSVCAKSIVVNTLSDSFTKKEITSKILDVVFETMPNSSSDELLTLQNSFYDSKEMKEITDIYFNSIVHDIENNTVSNVDFSKQLDSLINNHIPNAYKDEVRNKINSIDFNRLYENILDYANSIVKNKYQFILSIYAFFTSLNTLLILSFLIVASFTLLIVINKSIKKSLFDIGIAFMISGGILMIIIFIVKRYGAALTNTYLGRTSSISIILPIVVCIFNLLSGFVMIGAYYNLENKKIKGEK